MRLDQYLHQNLSIHSRTRAADLIKAGKVKINGLVVKKPSLKVGEADAVEVEDLKYVSRAGLKLEGALRHSNCVVQGLTVLDVGQSTGGFTDCLLQLGAKYVVGIDVGRDQLHEKIKQDKRVQYFEGVNAKDPIAGVDMVDLIVMDVSFISITKVLASVVKHLNSSGHILSLVKPQFELDEKGVIVSEADYEKIQEKIIQACGSLQLKIIDYFESSILGKDGNREFFVYAVKN